jgi:hypothetical protein
LDKNPQNKDEALEALDFIVNVLKEHEKDLDKLINELATVTEQIGDTGELSSQVEKVEEKVTSLQKEVTSLVSYLSIIEPKDAKTIQQKQMPNESNLPPSNVNHMVQPGPSMVLHCRQWEDFQTLATQAQTLSFYFKEDEKCFQADALRGNQIITYSGPSPKVSAILKSWLSKQLDVPEKSILEGALAIS